MVRIINSHETGKTKKLMLLAQTHNALFVCANPDAMQVKANSYGITGVQFVSYYDYLHLNYEPEDVDVVVDELENLVQCMLDGKLVGYSLSDND